MNCALLGCAQWSVLCWALGSVAFPARPVFREAVVLLGEKPPRGAPLVERERNRSVLGSSVAGSGQGLGVIFSSRAGRLYFLEWRSPARWSTLLRLPGWEIKKTGLCVSESQGHIFQLDLCSYKNADSWAMPQNYGITLSGGVAWGCALNQGPG